MYWKSCGPTNSANTINLALEVANVHGINDIVVASNSGKTAGLLAGRVGNIVCVTQACGYAEAGKHEMSKEVRVHLSAQGVKILTTTHVLSGAKRGISRKFGEPIR